MACSKMTQVYEGSLIRLFRRLEELLRQIGQAAKVMGNSELEKKFEESLGKIRRDIVVRIRPQFRFLTTLRAELIWLSRPHNLSIFEILLSITTEKRTLVIHIVVHVIFAPCRVDSTVRHILDE